MDSIRYIITEYHHTHNPEWDISERGAYCRRRMCGAKSNHAPSQNNMNSIIIIICHCISITTLLYHRRYSDVGNNTDVCGFRSRRAERFAPPRSTAAKCRERDVRKTHFGINDIRNARCILFRI